MAQWPTARLPSRRAALEPCVRNLHRCSTSDSHERIRALFGGDLYELKIAELSVLGIRNVQQHLKPVREEKLWEQRRKTAY